MNTQRQIKIAFARFWPRFDPQQSLFTRLLRKSYDVRFDCEPELVFYSCFRGPMPPGEYVKVFYTGECVRPPWGECDWAFSFDYDDHPRHYRLPNYVVSYDGAECLIKTPEKIAAWMRAKTRFCNFVYSNPVRFRNAFFQRLSRYKAVDAPGRCMQNMPPIGPYANALQSRRAHDSKQTKVGFLQPYQFTIAFENQSYPGYVTEKIYQAMQAGSIPIYWGDPLVHRDFNPRSFVNYHEYEAAVKARLPAFLLRWPLLRTLIERWYVRPRTLDKVIERVLAICDDDRLYTQYLSEPWFAGNQPPPVFDLQRLEQRLHEIVGSLGDPICAGAHGLEERAMKKVLVNFANDHFLQSQELNSRSGLGIAGFDEVRSYHLCDIDADFRRRSQHILDCPRGAGYWLWKPYFIQQTLAELSPGDVLFYWDSGAEFIAPIEPLIRLCADFAQDVVHFELCGLEKHWTKRNAFLLLDCDTPEYAETKQRLASFILIRKSHFSDEFVGQHLAYCQDERMITDLENQLGYPDYEGFVEHRHDQSVLSLLSKKHRLKAFRDPSQWGNTCRQHYPESSYPQLINLTRRRDRSPWPVVWARKMTGLVRTLINNK